MWQRSFRNCDVLIAEHGPGDHFTCTSEFGVLVFETESNQQGAVLPGWSYFVMPLPRRFRQHDDVLGFAAYRGVARHYVLLPRTTLRGITIPYWFIFTATAVTPALWLLRRQRRARAARRLQRSLCPRCNYDLRASTGRCPECGTPFIQVERAVTRDFHV